MRNALKILAAAFLAAAISAACSPAPQAQPASASAPAISLVDPWAAATPAGARVGAGYVMLHNAGGADRLVSAASPRAARVELHEMSMSNGVMNMRRVQGIDVPAHGMATLAPGGYHIMFIDIDAPFGEGQTIPVTLRFEHAGQIEAAFVVRPRQASGGDHEHH